MVALHIFCVLVCFLKQLQNFALGDIFFVLVCSAMNLLLSEYFERKALLSKKIFFNLCYKLVKCVLKNIFQMLSMLVNSRRISFSFS